LNIAIDEPDRPYCREKIREVVEEQKLWDKHKLAFAEKTVKNSFLERKKLRT
jgi:hypothetical protein